MFLRTLFHGVIALNRPFSLRYCLGKEKQNLFVIGENDIQSVKIFLNISYKIPFLARFAHSSTIFYPLRMKFDFFPTRYKIDEQNFSEKITFYDIVLFLQKNPLIKRFPSRLIISHFMQFLSRE